MIVQTYVYIIILSIYKGQTHWLITKSEPTDRIAMKVGTQFALRLMLTTKRFRPIQLSSWSWPLLNTYLYIVLHYSVSNTSALSNLIHMVTILKYKRGSLSIYHCFRCSDGLGGGVEEDKVTGYRPSWRGMCTLGVQVIPFIKYCV